MKTPCIFQLILAAVVARIVVGERPNQPPGFASARSTLTPLLSYSFRQAECAATSTFSEDVTGLAALTRNTTATSCPSRVASSNTFQNAVVGATIVDTLNPEALKSSTLSTTFNGLGGQLGVEIWYSFDSNQTDSVQYRLIEIGDSGGTGLTPGVVANTVQLAVSIRAASGGDTLTVSLAWKDSPTTTFANDLNFANGGFRTSLTNLRLSPFKTLLFLALSISDVSGNCQVNAFAGSPGQGVVTSSTGELNVPLVGFALSPASVMRIGTTRGPNPLTNGQTGVPGSIHHVAFYGSTIDSTTALAMLNSGLPNSNPVVRSVTFSLLEDVTSVINLNQPNISVFDFDGSIINNFRIRTLPLKGMLFYNGNPINSSVMEFVVNNSSLLTYRALPDEFGAAYSLFTFSASDNICDSSGTPRSAANCNSPVNATATINVIEANDPPELANVRTSFNVFAGSNNTLAFSITCRDRDVDTSAFGLSSVTLLNSSTLNLGSIYLVENGTTGNCTGNGTFSSPSRLPFVVNTTEVVPSNTSRTWSFCYRANPTAVTTVDVGTDVIAYTCNDRFGANVNGSVSVNVKNALIAGCGTPFTTRDQWTDGVECYGYAQEDTNLLITLTGFDAVASHDPLRRLYRLATLPTTGTLRTLAGDVVNTSSILRADNTTTVEWNGRNVSLLAGNLTLEFVPNPDYYNTICDLNIDPIAPDSVTGSANCLGKSNVAPRPYVYVDGLGRGINGCNVTANPRGCPDSFTFILGYNETTGPAFGDVSKKPFFIYTVGVNDNINHPLTNFTAPFNISMPRPNINSFVNLNSTGPLLRFADVDGDTYRLGFFIRMSRSLALLKCPFFDTPFVGPYKRLSWLEGDSCRSTGASSCRFLGKAYMTDLNGLFDCIQTSTAQSRITNDSILVTLFDPVPSPEEFNPDTFFSVELQLSNLTASIFLAIGTPAPPADSTLTGALWAGIAAGLFFIAMSCFACIGCVISRAKRGEEAAVWVVKNMLCTDVETRKNADISKLAAGGRRSLEVAIHAEHTRLARVVCCALFMRKMFPCLVKFDANELKVPDEEDMLQEAVKQTRKRIASMHRPKDGAPVPAAAVASDDVEDVVAEDVLADDSIFDWERHLDDKTGKVFYYNVKTHESRWTPPTVKVHEQRKITDRTSVKMDNTGLFSPKPPEQPKNKGGNEGEDQESDRTKKGN